MLLKIMSDGPFTDRDPRKAHRVIADVDDVDFRESGAAAKARVKLRGKGDVIICDIPSVAYLMSDEGRTISIFAAGELHTRASGA